MASKKKAKKAKPAVKAKKVIKKAKPVKVVKKTKPKMAVKTKAKVKNKQVTKIKKAAVKTIQTKAKSLAKASTAKVDYSKAITPLGDRLVVRVANGERVTAGGLIIPDTVSSATGFLKATVLAVGRGSQNKKGFIKLMDVQVGDSVLFSEHAGTKVKFNSEDLQIIHETDVMGIVQK